jgi:nucleoside-diphosphate-sugar epimerase
MPLLHVEFRVECGGTGYRPGTRIILVGGSGNIGTAVLRKLSAEHPDWQLVGLSRRSPAPAAPYDRVSWHRVDVSDPAVTPMLAKLFAGADAVVNFAWGFQPTRNAEYLQRVGPGAVRSIADAAISGGVGQLVQLSSVGAYRAADRPGRYVDESWPTSGIPSSLYSRHKAEAERVLDEFEQRSGRVVVTRIRHGLVMQREAGGSLARYGLPGYLPAVALRLLPVVPVGRRLVIPVVHADDVAGAIVAAVARRAAGAFNVAAEPPVTGTDIAAILRAWSVSMPPPVLHVLAQLTWRLRLQRIDAGWLDLAFSVPLLDCSRAREELDWRPAIDPRVALAQAISGITDGVGGQSAVLRRRTVRAQLTDLLRDGPITTREMP